jgi:hypothetical protein
MIGEVQTFRWSGAEQLYLDEPVVETCERVVIGRYGGSLHAGAHKNEDGALVFCGEDWEFAVLIDAHYSSQSAALIVSAIEAKKEEIVSCLSLGLESSFTRLYTALVELFSSQDFRHKCDEVKGEASVLICARKGGFLWWMNVGDVLVFLLHSELARMGQYALNQRSFFEWIGQRNTFDLPVPCYATGVRQLMYDRNRVVMTTDGLLEFGEERFNDHEFLYEFFASMGNLVQGVREALGQVHVGNGKDSATIIAWDCYG